MTILRDPRTTNILSLPLPITGGGEQEDFAVPSAWNTGRRQSITPPQPTEDLMGRNVTLSIGALILLVIVVAFLF
jgi:hypothetical protein